MTNTTLAPAALTFINPMLDSGADPWVVRADDDYIYCSVDGQGQVCLRRAPSVPELAEAETVVVWTPPSHGRYSQNVWAPELHLLDSDWFIYVAADDGRNENHRMHVLGARTDDPLGPYDYLGQIGDEPNRWAIDGTVVEMPDGDRYFLWSGWAGEENVRQSIYIARMLDPLRLEGTGVCISTSEHPWEMVGRPLVNEGPQALWNGDQLFVIYSASGSWTDDYCLGQLTFLGGDPLSPDSWTKTDSPVFSAANGTYGPGHASFVQDPTGTTWILFHSPRHSGAGWDRIVHAQPIAWKSDGSPDLGCPLPVGTALRWPVTPGSDRQGT